MVKRLYHGTSGLDPRVVLKSIEGFDLKYNEWGIHGQGNYFATIPDYCEGTHPYGVKKGNVDFTHKMPNTSPARY